MSIVDGRKACQVLSCKHSACRLRTPLKGRLENLLHKHSASRVRTLAPMGDLSRSAHWHRRVRTLAAVEVADGRPFKGPHTDRRRSRARSKPSQACLGPGLACLSLRPPPPPLVGRACCRPGPRGCPAAYCIYYILYIYYIGGERRRRKADLDLAVVRLDRRREPGGGRRTERGRKLRFGDGIN